MHHIFFFFFSSRRRHTRSKRDWSSDVCSSDLRRLLQLQESWSHKKTKWMDLAWAPVLYYGDALVCLRCEKRLKIKRGWESVRAVTPKETQLRNKMDKEKMRIGRKFRKIAEKNLRKDRELLEKLAKV